MKKNNNFFPLYFLPLTDNKCFHLGLDDDDDNNDNPISYQCCPKSADKETTLSVVNRKRIISKDGSCFMFPKETEQKTKPPKKQIATTKKDDTKTKTKGTTAAAAKKVTKKGNTVDTLDLIGTDVGWMKLIRCIFSN